MGEPLGTPTFILHYNPDTMEVTKAVQHKTLDASKVPEADIERMARRILANMRKEDHT